MEGRGRGGRLRGEGEEEEGCKGERGRRGRRRGRREERGRREVQGRGHGNRNVQVGFESVADCL